VARVDDIRLGAVAACLVAALTTLNAVQELPRPKPKADRPAAKELPRPVSAPSTELVVSTDIDAKVRVDANPEVTMYRGDVKVILVLPGDHLLTFVSSDGVLRKQTTIRVQAGNRAIATIDAAGDLEEARADREEATRESRERGARAARAASYGAMPWVQLPAATFTIGCVPGDSGCLPDERPSRPVDVPAFEIMPAEVSVAQIQQFGSTTGATLPPQPEWNSEADMPAVNVSWRRAQEYCASLGARLPSEPEWERAARAAGGGIYSWGDRFAAGAANLTGVGGADRWPSTAPIGSFASSAGLYDMVGNVWEWTTTADGAFHIIKGGGWATGPAAARISARGRLANDAIDETVGFRCVRSAR
jgi:formylglycine-generating enzyme required for sulfatase activity